MTSFPAVGGYFGAVRVQRLKLWVLWSSQPCVRPQGAGACLLYWGSSTQRAVISVGCALFLRKHAAQLTCWQYVSAVVTTLRRLSSTSIGRRGRWHARVGNAYIFGTLAESGLAVDPRWETIWVYAGVLSTRPGVGSPIPYGARLLGLGFGLPPSLWHTAGLTTLCGVRPCQTCKDSFRAVIILVQV